MSTPDHRKRWLATLAGIALAMVPVLNGCGSGEARTVPVLWAAEQSDGTIAGGVEPAGVEVESIGEPGFSLSLEDVAAEGAGDQWQAASASAAAIGTLLSGADPNEVDVNFAVTGPIDGPSGGAALTVGVLAAIRGEELRSGVTMTGTINPDGSVGPVTNVPTKIRSAAEDGYEVVLIPRGTEIGFDPEAGREVGLKKLGRSLGLEVKVVPDIGSAYRAFTGSRITPATAEPPTLDPPVRKVAERTTSRLDRRIATALNADLSGDLTDRRTRSLALEAVAAGKSGDTALAYALGVDALKAIERDRLADVVRRTFEAKGANAAERLLDERVWSLRQRADRVTSRAIGRVGPSYEQQLLLPVALGWITYSTALLEVVDDRLGAKREPSSEELDELARVTADAGSSIEVFGPDALEAARASREKDSPPRSEEEVTAFLSGYTNFLIRGGRASEAYFRDVVEAIGPSEVPGYIYPTFRELGQTVGQISEGTERLDREIIQASLAISYFVIGAILVSADPILGLDTIGLGEEIPSGAGSELLPNAAEGALDTVDGLSVVLQRRGLSAGYPVWSSRWGRAGFEAFRLGERAATGAVLALEEAWYSAIGCFMLEGLTVSGEDG